LLEAQAHAGVRRLVSDLNTVYRELPALHQRDCEPEGFEWIIANDQTNSILAWVRRAPDQPPVVVITNFTPVPRTGFRLPMPAAGRWIERINTDAGWYNGSNTGNQGVVNATPGNEYGYPATADLVLPPLATLILQFEPG
jgi:1,4-alpha-glucan branching enzyme